MKRVIEKPDKDKTCMTPILKHYVLVIITHVTVARLQATKEKVTELQSAAASLEREVGGVRAELRKYRTRAEVLERNRRLGTDGVRAGVQPDRAGVGWGGFGSAGWQSG